MTVQKFRLPPEARRSEEVVDALIGYLKAGNAFTLNQYGTKFVVFALGEDGHRNVFCQRRVPNGFGVAPGVEVPSHPLDDRVDESGMRRHLYIMVPSGAVHARTVGMVLRWQESQKKKH